MKQINITRILVLLTFVLSVFNLSKADNEVSTNLTINSSIEEIREELKSMNIPVLSFTFEGDEFPSYDVIDAPEGCMGKSIINNDYVKGSLVITLGNEEIYNSGEFEDKESGVKVKYRGNTSTAQDYIKKKSFKIKLSKKEDLLFRGDKKYKDKEWVLLNGNKDINYVMGTQIAKICGIKWEPAGKSVCVIMNDRYMGYYFLVESIKGSEVRVNIQDTGFIIENDAYWWKPDEVYFKTNFLPNSMGWTFKEPDTDDIEEDDITNIKNVVQIFENSLYNHENIEEMYDKESFVSWLLSHDILGTIDAGGSNMFITKEDYNSDDLFASKLKMGPLWDFDDCFKSEDNSHAAIFNTNIFWFKELLTYSDFYEIVIKNWESLKDILIDELKPVVENYLIENPEIYKARLIDHNLQLLGRTPLTDPQSDYVEKLSWLKNRLNALDNLNKIIPVGKIIINNSQLEIYAGENIQLEAITYPDNATEKILTWSSSEEKVATVSDSGLVTAIAEGSAIITATCGNVSTTCEITVLTPIIDAEQIVLNLESAELNIGETVQLDAKVLPEDTTDKTVVWNSSDPKVATVAAEGLVTALSAGSAIITASCGDVSAECAVTVLKDSGVENIITNPDSSISIYTTDGILIKKNCTGKDLKTLSKGIYIIVSGKDRYQISI